MNEASRHSAALALHRLQRGLWGSRSSFGLSAAAAARRAQTLPGIFCASAFTEGIGSHDPRASPLVFFFRSQETALPGGRRMGGALLSPPLPLQRALERALPSCRSGGGDGQRRLFSSGLRNTKAGKGRRGCPSRWAGTRARVLGRDVPSSSLRT